MHQILNRMLTKSSRDYARLADLTSIRYASAESFAFIIIITTILNDGDLRLMKNGEVVEAQLVERSLPTSEVHGLNPVIGKLLYRTFCLLSTVLKRQKLKKKRPGITHLIIGVTKRSYLLTLETFLPETQEIFDSNINCRPS